MLLRTLVSPAGVFALVFTTNIAAACSDRPGTPSNVSAAPLFGSASTAIRFSFTNHGSYNPITGASERQWWDVSVREGSPDGPAIGKDLTGAGPSQTGTNSFVFIDFKGLKPSTQYCFRIRARSAPGTKGCVSARWSNWACASTADAPAGPPVAVTNLWGAVAVNGNGRWGYAVGQRSRELAESKALQGCGAPSCHIGRVAQANCVAYAESRRGGYWYGFSVDHAKWRVRSVAMDGCGIGAPAGSCRLVEAVCR